MSTDDNPAAIERKLPEGCRRALAMQRDGYVDADAGAGRTNNALQLRGLLDDRDPAWMDWLAWGRKLTPLGQQVAALARESERPGGGRRKRARR